VILYTYNKGKQMAVTDYVWNAVYRNEKTEEEFIFLGAKNKTVILAYREDSKKYLELTHEVFEKDFVDMNIHNHKAYCCTVHNTHADMMHQGCILR
jgi:hypothetical protein